MDGLQRSAVSFRRQGSSGLVWDDKFLKELNQESNNKQKEQDQAAAEISSQQQDQQEQQQPQAQVDVKPVKSINTIERSRSNGGGAGARGHRTGRVSPAIEPPSPRISACGFCSAFANKPPKNNNHTKRTGKRRSRPF